MIRAAYLVAAQAAVALLREPAVAAQWGSQSALEHFAVSGLAGHLARSITQMQRILADPPGVGPAIPLLDHFARSAWTASSSPEEQVHIEIRSRGEGTAGEGPAVLAEKSQTALAWLQQRLPAEAADRVVELRGAWCLTLDDFLTTRLLETVVHVDDLAIITAVEPPQLPAQVTQPVIDLLAQLATVRHGPTAVIRTFSRTERAPETVSAF